MNKVQLSREEACEFFDKEQWKPLTHWERAVFQLEQDRLCMPFGVFHEALEESLGEPVTTLGIALCRDGLLKTLKEKQ